MVAVPLALTFLMAGTSFSDPLFSLRMSPGHPSETIEIQIGIIPRTTAEMVSSPDKELEYWARMTVRLSDLKAVYWTRSDRCPQLKTVLNGLAQIKLPRPWVPGEPVVLRTDARRYELTLPSTYDGKVGVTTVKAQHDTPLATTFDYSYRELHACWSGRPPR